MTPGLYGLEKHRSNRDFTKATSWGKNQFNSSFPASLACYMQSIDMRPLYLTLDNNLEIYKDFISVTNLFGLPAHSPELFFSFESVYTPYQNLIIGNLPRTDLVTMNTTLGTCLRGLEIKLTALPDNTTCDLDESKYSCEIVVRPDTIVYLALSIVKKFANKHSVLENIFLGRFNGLLDWTDPKVILLYLDEMLDVLDDLFLTNLEQQEPFLFQPIWKTLGKTAQLHKDSLDIIIWSNFAFTRLFLDSARRGGNRISRSMRTVIWLVKMLYDFAENRQFDHASIIDNLSLNTKNDKAFAISGILTHPYLKSDILSKPRISKDQIREIILGGGQNLLSPERRLDAIIQNTPGLFD